MNDASNFPESEQPEHNPAASDAAQEADANTSAQAQTPADDNAATARTLADADHSYDGAAEPSTPTDVSADPAEPTEPADASAPTQEP